MVLACRKPPSKEEAIGPYCLLPKETRQRPCFYLFGAKESHFKKVLRTLNKLIEDQNEKTKS